MFRRIAMNRCLLASLFPLTLVLLSVLPSRGQDNKPPEKHLEVDLGGGIKMKLVRIEAGKFIMGSPKSEERYIRQRIGTFHGDWVAAHEKQHKVEITRPFYMGVYAVTQAEYEKLMGKNPSYWGPSGRGKGRVAKLDTARFPVEQVSWEVAMAFCRKMSQKVGKTFDLPTEAEWEYACRAGATGLFHFGNSLSAKQANINPMNNFYGGEDRGPYLERTTRVGSYEPNAFGLYDMHGNVKQWCKDWCNMDYYGESPPRDPQGPANGVARVVRGSSWDDGANGECRSAYREGSESGDNCIGFRVVMRVP